MDPFRFVLIAVAGWRHQRQLQVINYLREENRVLREQLGGRRLRLNDNQRRRLATRAKCLGRKLLAEVATIVTPETLLAWHRRMLHRRARAAGSDPCEFRLKQLRPRNGEASRGDQPRRAKIRLGKPLPAGEGRGIACYAGFGSYIAHVAEVSVASAGVVRVRRIISAVRLRNRRESGWSASHVRRRGQLRTYACSYWRNHGAGWRCEAK